MAQIELGKGKGKKAIHRQGCVHQAAKWPWVKPNGDHTICRSQVPHGTAHLSVTCLFSMDVSAVEHTRISRSSGLGFELHSL